MTYRKVAKLFPSDQQVYARIDEDGLCRVTCTGDNPEFMAWVAEGNTPEDADDGLPA